MKNFQMDRNYLFEIIQLVVVHIRTTRSDEASFAEGGTFTGTLCDIDISACVKEKDNMRLFSFSSECQGIWSFN